jgi:hypothetical protein
MNKSFLMLSPHTNIIILIYLSQASILSLKNQVIKFPFVPQNLIVLSSGMKDDASFESESGEKNNDDDVSLDAE